MERKAFDILNAMINRINSGERTFLLPNKKDPRYLISVLEIGNGMIVNKQNCFLLEDVFVDSEAPSQNAAIIDSNGYVYLEHLYVFGEIKAEDLPLNVTCIEDGYNNLIETNVRQYVSNYVARLPDIPIEVTEKNEYSLRNRARANIVYGPFIDLPRSEQSGWLRGLYTLIDFKMTLCGLVDLEQLLHDRLGKLENSFTMEKATRKIVEQLENDPVTMSDSDRRLADALRGIDAKNVNVEFERDGKTAVGKLEPYNIQEALSDMRGAISVYSFSVLREGREVFDALGLKPTSWGADEIKCKDIKRITYRGKELYTR